jgi:hypothetical protein
MPDDVKQYYSEGRGLLTLWGGLLLAPAAWVLHQQSSYLLVYWACPNGQTFVFHIGTIVLLLLAGAGTYLGWTAWMHSGRGWADEGGSVVDRTRFMALSGFLLSGLFLLVIVAQWIPTFIVDPCVR